jgi:hypothetical protein
MSEVPLTTSRTSCGFKNRCKLSDVSGDPATSTAGPKWPKKGGFGPLARPAKRHYTFAVAALIPT